MNEVDKARLGLIPVLAEHASAGHIGRTALMKYAYFLQTLRDVPLGYSFSMHSYGPFDSDVLMDLRSAAELNIVDVTPVEFAGGYGYRIKPGVRAESAKKDAARFLTQHARDIDWLFSVFGSLNSAELELTSTIVYVDREFADRQQHGSLLDIVSRVREIKPRFTQEQVQEFVRMLLDHAVLHSTQAGIHGYGSL
jgi:hypothetical protein